MGKVRAAVNLVNAMCLLIVLCHLTSYSIGDAGIMELVCQMLNKISVSPEKFNSVSYDFKMIKAVDSKIRIILDCLKYKPGGAAGRADGATAKVRAGPRGRFPSAQPC